MRVGDGKSFFGISGCLRLISFLAVCAGNNVGGLLFDSVCDLMCRIAGARGIAVA